MSGPVGAPGSLGDLGTRLHRGELLTATRSQKTGDGQKLPAQGFRGCAKDRDVRVCDVPKCGLVQES